MNKLSKVYSDKIIYTIKTFYLLNAIPNHIYMKCLNYELNYFIVKVCLAAASYSL
jgi:hypothetical protein